MDNKRPHIGINWGKVGGRKFVAAFVTFLTALTNALAGDILDIRTLTISVLGFLLFIIVEGIIDFKAANNTTPKSTLSGKLKKEIAELREIIGNTGVGAIKPKELPEMKENINNEESE